MTGTWLLNSFSTPKCDTECYQKATSSELFLKEERLRHCKTVLLPRALKDFYVHKEKKNGVGAV